MKKLLNFALALMTLAAFAAIPALAELPAAATPEPGLIEAAPSEAVGATGEIAEPAPAEPFTWEYLATIAGTAAATWLIVQFVKAPVDKLWKIPTRVLVYAISLVIMLVATAFNGGLTQETALLAVLNAFVAANVAMGAYEQTFAVLEARKKLEAAK